MSHFTLPTFYTASPLIPDGQLGDSPSSHPPVCKVTYNHRRDHVTAPNHQSATVSWDTPPATTHRCASNETRQTPRRQQE